MTTTLQCLPTPKQPRSRQPHSRQRRTRQFGSLPAAGGALALALVIILNPNVASVHATGVFGALRAPGERAFIAAHRGDRTVAPENTIPALRAALASTLDFVETDVQLSADGVPVVIHDRSVDRTTNGTGIVADLTLAELRQLDAGAWYSPGFAGTVIPTLDEFLAVVGEATRAERASDGTAKKLLMELKGTWSIDEVKIVNNLVTTHGVRDLVTFASFDFTTLMHVEAVSPTSPRVIIRKDLPADPVALAQHFGAIAILTSPASLEADPGAVEAMHEAGLGILLYTLNTEERWTEALALGVDGIITDKPSSLDEWLAATAPGT